MGLGRLLGLPGCALASNTPLLLRRLQASQRGAKPVPDTSSEGRRAGPVEEPAIFDLRVVSWGSVLGTETT